MTDQYRALLECGVGPIADMAMKCEGVLATHRHALVSVSGGADSDVMMDVVERVRTQQPIEVTYVWFNTGIEYKATKEHLCDLEEKYGVSIERVRAEKTVPVSCNEYGQPFISKHVSEMCERLQSVCFQWEDEPYEVLDERYPRCRSALRWWCNDYKISGIPQGRFNIRRNKWLKEFLIANPPTFRISAKCCEYAKKRPSRQIELAGGVDVTLIGVRLAEGGVRASHKTCFDKGGHGVDTYRPLFWLTDRDRDMYCGLFGVTHSDCYRIWGLKRTGCVGCPFGRERLAELGVIEHFEPRMAQACRKVFADAYEYTAKYQAFARRMTLEHFGQMRMEI
jgi:3'-phosphoadenosine 5'-phosphosulfate sulfotransferase (PAPS reductase)/FAD synthetase